MLSNSPTGEEVLSQVIRYLNELDGLQASKALRALEILEVAHCEMMAYADEESDSTIYDLTFYVSPSDVTKAAERWFSDLIREVMIRLVPERDPGVRTDIKALLPEQQHSVGLNNCHFKQEKTILHDELRFRSPAEIAIYDELCKRPILFFPNAAAILAGDGRAKKEPDFLICDKGKWGILEVMGETYHTNAVKDHDRARFFKEYGILCIEFFSASACKNSPSLVVDQFLGVLNQHR